MYLKIGGPRTGERLQIQTHLKIPPRVIPPLDLVPSLSPWARRNLPGLQLDQKDSTGKPWQEFRN